jgi:hypothetical protein
VRHSQSNLSSLAALLRNAEARASATPPPLPPDALEAGDSGLIDIVAMQQRAREERALAAIATKTPVPVVTAVRSAATDPDFVASLAQTKRRTKRIAIGVVAGVALILAVGIGIKSARHTLGAAHAPPAPSPVAVQAATPPAPPAPPPVVQAPAPPPPPVAAAAPEPEPAAAPGKKGKKGHKASHSAKSKGLKLTKVTSSGVAN